MGLLEFLACFDWISPLIALGETVIHGHGWTFYLDLDSGWTGAQCEKILKSKGVKVYGRCIAQGDAFFQVPKKQAEWAEYLLLRAGAPLKYHLFSERNRMYLAQPEPMRELGELESIFRRTVTWTEPDPTREPGEMESIFLDLINKVFG